MSAVCGIHKQKDACALDAYFVLFKLLCDGFACERLLVHVPITAAIIILKQMLNSKKAIINIRGCLVHIRKSSLQLIL